MKTYKAALILLAGVLIGVAAHAGTISQTINTDTGDWELHMRRNAPVSLIEIPLVDSDGSQRPPAILRVFMDGTKITDKRGTVIVAPVPAALLSDMTSLTSRINTAIDNGITAGKIRP